MTEASYEQLRDTTEGDAGIAWRDADRWSSYLREKFEVLKADEKLSEEGKYKAAEEYLEKTRPRIEQAYEAARKHLEAEAKRQWDAAVPLPDDQDLSTTKVKDSSEMLAIQGEARAIVARVERMRERMPKGIRGDHTADVLRDTYGSAMDEGGIEGRIKAYGVLKAAEQLHLRMNRKLKVSVKCVVWVLRPQARSRWPLLAIALCPLLVRFLFGDGEIDHLGVWCSPRCWRAECSPTLEQGKGLVRRREGR
jgi:hypothetical protein